jgi:UDP-N-acetylglucosamine 1-carboxyvinyltransferase
MGAKVKGAGSNKIEIEGVKNLKDVSYNIMPDRIEAGTFLCMAAMTNGNILLKNVNAEDIIPVIEKLKEAGCKIKLEKSQIEIQGPKRLKSIDIKTMPYPGFPTDMQSIFATALTTARGTSVVIENIFENRYKYTQELIRMGAKITIEGKTAVIKGVKKLYGANVKATDLRGGAALVIAGIAAKGVTSIENIEYILRGYEKFDKKIQKLGINIKGVN